MNLISQSELARRAGVTRSAVNDAVKKKSIPFVVIEGKKKIDLDDKIIKDYLKGNRQRDIKNDDKKTEQKKKTGNIKSPAKKQQTKKPAKKKAEPKGKKKAQKPASKMPAIIIPDNDEDEDGGADKYLLQCKKLEADIKKIEQATSEKRHELIPRDFVKQFIDEIYQIDSQEFLQLSSNLTAKICQGVFKNDDNKIMIRVSKMIDKETYKTLAHVQRKIDDFLAKIENKINQEIA